MGAPIPIGSSRLQVREWADSFVRIDLAVFDDSTRVHSSWSLELLPDEARAVAGQLLKGAAAVEREG